MTSANGMRSLQSAEFTIGTRGSPLALAQAEEVRRRIADRGLASVDEIAVEAIRTTGDRITDRPLAEAGGKGLFTKEIDEALLAGRVDFAVHSAKDMPTRLPDGITIAAVLPRAAVRDAEGPAERGGARNIVASPCGDGAPPAAGSEDRQPPRQCRHEAEEARSRRGGCDPACRRGSDPPRAPRPCREFPRRCRVAAGRRAGCDCPRRTRRGRIDTSPACADLASGHGRGACRRAGLPRRARRLLPDADRRL